MLAHNCTLITDDRSVPSMFGAPHPGDCTGDLLITKNLRWLQKLQAIHTEVPDINNLGNLLSLKQQLPKLKTAGVLAQF